jgi:hypothetical protein
MASGYPPEVDSSSYLEPGRASYFMSLMGILRWAIELGQINIMVEAGLLSRFLAAPREGHLEQMFHIMAYLKNHNKSRLAFDYTHPTFTNVNQNDVDWQQYYPEKVNQYRQTCQNQEVVRSLQLALLMRIMPDVNCHVDRIQELLYL